METTHGYAPFAKYNGHTQEQRRGFSHVQTPKAATAVGFDTEAVTTTPAIAEWEAGFSSCQALGQGSTVTLSLT